MKIFIRVAITFAILLCASPSAPAAEIKIGLFDLTAENFREFDPNDPGKIHIVGEIEQGDLEKLERQCGYLIMFKRPIIVRIDTPGGDWREALKMGRFLRSMRARITVAGRKNNASPTRCHGAGVLILAGAPIREYGIGAREAEEDFLPNVALSRPNLSRELLAKLNAEQARLELTLLAAEVRNYLDDMGAPPELAERMFRVPTGKLDYAADSTLLGLAKGLEELGIKRRLPDFVSREHPIDEYLPEMEPFIRKWMGRSCPEPITDEERYDLQINKGSESYRQHLAQKNEAYTACESESLVLHQREQFKMRIIEKGIDPEQLATEVLAELNKHLDKEFPESATR